jgi:UDP-N-acetylglucosamine 2-epimerase (non-hydrolysing)
MPAKLICIAGARPNFMKLAPLLRELSADPDLCVLLAHTGQHYSDKMSGQFFRDLALPPPDYYLEVGSGSHAQQTAAIMSRLEPVIQKEQPDGVVVIGDVNSTMAAAIVAKKLQTGVVHVEAGLRSFDRTMPEEINRIVTDAISDLLLVTEESGRRNLLAEGVSDTKIHLVGNLMIDSLRFHLQRAQQESAIVSRLGIEGISFALLTLHRPANVDEAGQLQRIMNALEIIARDLPTYFPVHPRTRSRLEAMTARDIPGIHLIEPLGYHDFLCLMSKAAVVLTDSGGIQEETTALGIPCLTIRDNTERPVTITEGTNLLAGTTTESILGAWRQFQTAPKTGRIPELWDGKAASRCRQVLREHFVRRQGTQTSALVL